MGWTRWLLSNTWNMTKVMGCPFHAWVVEDYDFCLLGLCPLPSEFVYCFKKFLLEYSCFTLSCYFKFTTKWIGYTYILSYLDSFPIQANTEYWVEFPVLYNRSLLIFILYIILFICQSQSPNLSLPSAFPSCIHKFSTSVTLFLFYK